MKFSTLINLVKIQSPAQVLLSILAVSLCFGASDRASASPTCANVNVNIQNGTPDTVKVTNFEYFDTTQNAFVPKNLLGPSGTQQLTSGTVHRATRNFAQVGGRTQFRVTYQHKQGINNFAAPVRVTTDRFVCIDGSTQPVLLDK
ncbi:hypothetical protein [Chamaesiphon minutus]|uniref:Uncharacterized protein n=1 Tax=Chamaesiphon minutus (strain ATCC 27169 / PCC 6605) TaxID=1173020 RepID=K9UCU7_CHAP6|nr:hypothetical protein [Chamaesiphon minutus]AFY92251.1 hypothetical protein Cha6605_1012 [Chamaesiphon minutus PCC 6605]